MKLTKCVNGHFYDEEKFEACPHCAGTSKLDASSIFGQSPEKPEFTAPPKEADSVEEPEFAKPPEESEFTSAPKEAGFAALPEEPEFTSAPKEAGFAELPEEPEFTSAPKEAGFVAPPEEPEFTPAPNTASIEEESAFDINAQPSFDTPLDFDNNFATDPAAATTDAAEEATDEATDEKEEGFALLSKYGSDTPAEGGAEEPVANLGSDDQPTEIVEEIGADLPNGLLSADEITGDISQPASTEPEVPSFSTEPEVPSFSAEPEVPTFSAGPEIPSFSTEPVNPAFVPEQPAAFDLSSEEDDDDEHTVAFYDDIFNEVSKTAAVETSSTDAFADAAAQAAAEVAEVAAQAATAPAESPVNATSTEDTSGEPNVFTAPPLPHVQTLPTPCVGWLIALNGAHVGQDFHLRVGKNYVGRDESMDVALTGDKSVSRHKHAIIIYEPKHHKYFIQPGESNELIYVNDEVVLLPMELKPYDLLVLGDVELWFMPLCDAEHNWSEVIRKLQEQMQQ